MTINGKEYRLAPHSEDVRETFTLAAREIRFVADREPLAAALLYTKFEYEWVKFLAGCSTGTGPYCEEAWNETIVEARLLVSLWDHIKERLDESPPAGSRG